MKLNRYMMSGIVIFTASVCAASPYQLSTHILDINKGKPAADVQVELYKLNNENGNWQQIAKNITDKNGRIAEFLPIQEGLNNNGVYKLKFQVKDYFERLQEQSFYPFVEVSFELNDHSHYHVPITLSPYGYSTYRGS
ncbi:transthyretin-like periplasmic protein [Actinobacillus lignieresii]|uniref:hydroxyisourate hydrolase n=1 Tax=Actinobacillus lignieresii TaxID=720 RepID=UPI000E19B82A|nr:hydroxyisourate hydrolase [Actinobacillus lignieresii]SUT96568.1 transthyretin-like periplasmic protein [Actinobacillus lignieresii]